MKNLNEVKKLQKLAGILKEDVHTDQSRSRIQKIATILSNLHKNISSDVQISAASKKGLLDAISELKDLFGRFIYGIIPEDVELVNRDKAIKDPSSYWNKGVKGPDVKIGTSVTISDDQGGGQGTVVAKGEEDGSEIAILRMADGNLDSYDLDYISSLLRTDDIEEVTKASTAGSNRYLFLILDRYEAADSKYFEFRSDLKPKEAFKFAVKNYHFEDDEEFEQYYKEELRYEIVVKKDFVTSDGEEQSLILIKLK